MKVLQAHRGGETRLLVVLDEPGDAYDVTGPLAANGQQGLAGAIKLARTEGCELGELIRTLATASQTLIPVDVVNGRFSEGDKWQTASPPVDAPEVWAAGVTYKTSREARLEETDGRSEFYSHVYEAERPELFLKDNEGRRTVGPHASIGIRGDSSTSVPEPEFALILDAEAQIVGITLGNDVTARDIEAENPLYLPQAKIFTAACALGPAATILDADVRITDHFDINLSIVSAEGVTRFEGSTSTTELNRSFAELAAHLSRYNVIGDGTVLMTGTGIVPPLSLGLRGGDQVQIWSTSLGALANTVVVVDERGRLAPAEPARTLS